MSKQNKWAGSLGKVASGGEGTKGGNTYSAPKAGPAPTAKSSPSQNVITERFSPGDNMGTGAISTHNSINAFTRGIKSRGPYGGPSFSSINNSKSDMQRSDTSGISKFNTPSGGGGGQRANTGGSGAKTSGSKVGSGKNWGISQNGRGGNKDGSGYQNLVK